MNQEKIMKNQFDELTKGMAQSVTRRGALKKFGFGLAGMALACLGLANKAEADPQPPSPCLPLGYLCRSNQDCCSGFCRKGGGPSKEGFKSNVGYCAPK